MSNVGFYLSLDKFERKENGDFDYSPVKERLFSAFEKNRKIIELLNEIFQEEKVEILIGHNPKITNRLEINKGKIKEVESSGVQKLSKMGGSTAVLITLNY